MKLTGLAQIRIRPLDAAAWVAVVLAMFFMAAQQNLWLDALRELPDGGRLSGDARGFFDLSRQARPFYAAHAREPLFPWLLKVANDDEAARRLTGWISIVLVGVIGVTGAKLAGPPAGALAAWIYSGTPLTSYYGVSGLREGLMSVLVLLFVLLLLLERTWPVRIGGAVLAAAMPLLRLEGLIIVPLLAGAWALLKWRRHAAAEAVAYALIAWLAVTPFLVNCRREFGSAFHSLNTHARYWRNHEFAGQPGHLTREEVLANAYGGEPTTSAWYVFGMHTLPEVVARYARGYRVALTTHIPRLLDDRWLLWLWPLGVLWDVARRRGFVTLAGLIAQLPFAFILPLNMVMADRPNPGVEFRFSLPLTPFVALWAAAGVVETTKWVLERYRGR